MSAQMIVTKRFISSNAHLVNIDLGFIPDYVDLLIGLDNTNPTRIKWWRQQYVTEAADKYGVSIDGGGIPTVPTAANAGISAFNTKYDGVWVPSPVDSQAVIFRKPATWAAATNYSTAHRARSATVAGDVVWPTVKNGYVYELTTVTAAGTTEPTWTLIPGESSTDAGANVFICRKERSGTYAPQGIQIGSTLMVDSDVCLLTAILGIDRENMGDAQNFYPTP